VVPFYVHPLGRPGRPSSGRERTGGWRGGFLLGALEVSVKEDLRKHLATMQRLQLLVDLFGVDWSHVWLQPLDGSVNIMPSLELQVGGRSGPGAAEGSIPPPAPRPPPAVHHAVRGLLLLSPAPRPFAHITCLLADIGKTCSILPSSHFRVPNITKPILLIQHSPQSQALVVHLPASPHHA
jgi:hypothetical protein